MTGRIKRLIVTLAMLSLLLSACLPEEDTEMTPVVPAEPTMPAEPPPTPTRLPPTPDQPRPTTTPIQTPPAPQTDTDRIAWGQELYMEACAACHQPAGEGFVGAYPPLSGNAFVAAQDPAPVIQVIITGRGGMPGFYEMLSEQEVALIVSYIRTAWGNQGSLVSEQDVTAAWEASGFPREVEEDEAEEEVEEAEDKDEGEQEDNE